MKSLKNYSKIVKAFLITFSMMVFLGGFSLCALCKSTSSPVTRFAVIGDFGEQNGGSQGVADLVKKWLPDFIITLGDNNYPAGTNATLDKNVGYLYSRYIYPYKGQYERSSVTENRFFPCIGNHDFDTDEGGPYLTYFSLPGNGYFYEFVKGDVHFFVLCSDPRYVGGISLESEQLKWVKEALKRSRQPWKVVYFHHPPYSSLARCTGETQLWKRNGERTIDAPFAEWGASIVLNGHVHSYERFEVDNIPYVINGLGGDLIFCDFVEKNLHAGSVKRFAGEHGAMFVEATKTKISFQFITVSGKVVDDFSLTK